MKRNRLSRIVFVLSAIVALLCWLVMFLAGHDVWQYAGRPDFWNLDVPPYLDMRAFAAAFYL